MNEMVSGIKVIKMYAWEKPFKMLVKLVRADEMNYVYKSYMLRSFSYNTQALVQKITMFLTLITVYFMHNTLTASSAFTLLQYFNLLRYSVGILLPSAIIVIAELKTAIERIEEFLLEEEVENYLDETWFDSEILLENVQASWSPSSINIRIPEFEVLSGRLCAVVGPVGSGKSSLFQIILGELKPFTGRVRLNYNISYCSQESWLFSSSIRNNILFGQDYDPKKYKNVIKMCSLDKDLQLLPSGDQCLVGEKGVMLSGGQRARINLARALYKDAAIYLLDDPLSAVDAHVGRHLFDECVLKYLENKTRILITHQLQYLKEADVIFVMRDGKIEASGTFEELKDSDIGFENILSEMDKEQEIRKSEEYMSSCTSRRLSNVDMPTEEIPQNIKPFKEYIKAGGSLFFITYFFTVTLVCQVFYSLADFWLVVWTKDEVNRNITKIEFANMTEAIPKYVYEIFVTKSITATDLNLITYSTIIVLAILFSALRMFSTGRFIWKASTNLHSKMFNSLLKAPIIFFNTHPSGQILNRFSKDIGVTDQLLPVSLLESSQLLLISLGGLILISFSSYYLFIYVGTFVILLYVLFLLFSKVSSQVKHLEGITKSPVFTHVNHSLMGITTIRANKSEKLLIKQFDTHQDVHTSADFLFTACSTAYSVWINKLCVLLNICVTFYFIIRNHAGFPVDESFVGLALSQTLAFNVLLQYAIHRSSEVVNQMTSVERILAYTKLEKEPMHNPKGVELKQTWPCYGRIEFVNVYLSYKYDEEPVLKNLNFVIAPNQKIGVVGRTGAGKSSLINALFRLFEFQGAIIIDNVNIGGIGLSSLRKKISIIPQEPVLFSNTVRYNLDPFNEYKDDEIWNAIIEVEMRDAIESLDYEITEGGANFSVGQRQLLCLARAILRKNKILVLDEATANVDLDSISGRTSSFKRLCEINFTPALFYR
ncbi:ATP-binding cassette subfamily C member 4 isoform X2 [Aethina tumida]|uniref:ATP-binding cassette subfamily C member 4 isoform X2 n=1 Tax=Aethina tumida TaxID=116153 RepID=UPI0021476B82|nr:ATP-binding cassette subfamily C member 4 isoform X2 [Aethina tumida]